MFFFILSRIVEWHLKEVSCFEMDKLNLELTLGRRIAKLCVLTSPSIKLGNRVKIDNKNSTKAEYISGNYLSDLVSKVSCFDI